ncbi:hypothetical protein [Streptomyces sp. NRRL S-1314]|uniref:hypothetical protein n=1 Tax=Streptomyces sp. NRRL S-1314 TaxID=1463882 RepID=UPI0004C6F74F|nr:hypothetical protein [Streptomyces sp. NRRL S-1314]
MQGTTTACLFAPNHRGEHPAPPGTLLEPRGLYCAWTRAVEQTNAQMAGEPSPVPLPTRMEQLRRGVSPTSNGWSIGYALDAAEESLHHPDTTVLEFAQEEFTRSRPI